MKMGLAYCSERIQTSYKVNVHKDDDADTHSYNNTVVGSDGILLAILIEIIYCVHAVGEPTNQRTNVRNPKHNHNNTNTKKKAKSSS